MSPPSRRRGLKFLLGLCYKFRPMSPPSRRRGLKLTYVWILANLRSRLLRGGVDWNLEYLDYEKIYASPPSRRRGLKLTYLTHLQCIPSRLLRGGVDWNTKYNEPPTVISCVASFAEAWIEIGIPAILVKTLTSRLLRGGVDWNLHKSLAFHANNVASFAEAWIEIYKIGVFTQNIVVASFAEAWIEMNLLSKRRLILPVASFAEAWIEICLPSGTTYPRRSPPSRRRGLKYVVTLSISTRTSRLLRGGVDWNGIQQPRTDYLEVASFAEAWIEINKGDMSAGDLESPPSRRRGLKCQSDGVVTNYHSRLLRGGVDWNFVRLKRPHKKKRRLLRGGVDWNLNLPLPVSCLWLSPPSRRRGLKFACMPVPDLPQRRLLRGGVDWNSSSTIYM